MEMKELVFLHSLQTSKYNFHVGKRCSAEMQGRVAVQLFNSPTRMISLKKENLTPFQLRSTTLCYGGFELDQVATSVRGFVKVTAIVKYILEYLSVDIGSRDDCIDVTACGIPIQASPAYTGPYTFSPKSALEPGTDTCWISCHVGMQPFENAWICFKFHHVIRVESFAVRIPPLPGGPLAVRVFYLEGSNDGQEWERSSPNLITHDTSDLQQFCVQPPAEFQYIRMRCLESADSVADKVGLWEVQFNTAL